MQKTLDENLDIIQNSDLQITLLDGDLNIIQKLDDEPNDVGGLTAAELKAEFDKAGNIIKEYLNGTLVPELLAEAAVEARRVENEAQRESAEQVRQENEEIRQAREAARQADADALAQELRDSAADTEADLTRAVNVLEAQVETREAALSFWEDYDPERVYVPGNKVAFEGSSYVNTAACTGVPPTGALPEEVAAGAAHWLLIAQKGRDGEGSLTPELGDERYLRLEGGIMTGALTVQPPAAEGNPATKAYADARETAAKAYADALKLAVDGNVFTREQTLAAETAALYELGSNAVPDAVFAKIRTLLSTAQTSADGRARTAHGSYHGTGNTAEIVLPFSAQVIFVFAPISNGGARAAALIGFPEKNIAVNFVQTYDNGTGAMQGSVGNFSADGITITIDRSKVPIFVKSGETYNYYALG